MPIIVQCPGCGSKFRAHEKLGGKQVKCLKCPTMIAVPASGSVQPGCLMPCAPQQPLAPSQPRRSLPSSVVEERATPTTKSEPYQSAELCCHCAKRVLFRRDGTCPVCGKGRTVTDTQSRTLPGSTVPGEKAHQMVSVPAGTSGGHLQETKKENPKASPKQASTAEALLGCLVLLLVGVGLFFGGRWVYRSLSGTPAELAGNFSEWGVGFSPPEGWTRLAKNEESEAVSLLQASMSGTNRRVLHAALWTSPDEGTAFLAGVFRDPAIHSAARFVDDERDKMKAAQQMGDVTTIHEIELKRLGDREVVVSDVERSNGGRGVCYHIPSQREVVCLMLVAKRASDFSNNRNQLDRVMQSLALNQSTLEAEEPVRTTPARGGGDGGSRVGFSDWELKILPWVLFFICSGLCGAAKVKK